MSQEVTVTDWHSLASDDIAELEVEYFASADFIEDDFVPGKLWQDGEWHDYEISEIYVWVTIEGRAVRLPINTERIRDEYADILHEALNREKPEPEVADGVVG